MFPVPVLVVVVCIVWIYIWLLYTGSLWWWILAGSRFPWTSCLRAKSLSSATKIFSEISMGFVQRTLWKTVQTSAWLQTRWIFVGPKRQSVPYLWKSRMQKSSYFCSRVAMWVGKQTVSWKKMCSEKRDLNRFFIPKSELLEILCHFSSFFLLVTSLLMLLLLFHFCWVIICSLLLDCLKRMIYASLLHAFLVLVKNGAFWLRVRTNP